MARQRPGFVIANLPPALRAALQPIADTLARIAGLGDTGRIKPLTGTVQPNLPAAALLADVIAARNADAEALRATRVKLNEVISRLQED